MTPDNKIAEYDLIAGAIELGLIAEPSGTWNTIDDEAWELADFQHVKNELAKEHKNESRRQTKNL